jgi:hypothetical protein
VCPAAGFASVRRQNASPFSRHRVNVL